MFFKKRKIDLGQSVASFRLSYLKLLLFFDVIATFQQVIRLITGGIEDTLFHGNIHLFVSDLYFFMAFLPMIALVGNIRVYEKGLHHISCPITSDCQILWSDIASVKKGFWSIIAYNDAGKRVASLPHRFWYHDFNALAHVTTQCAGLNHPLSNILNEEGHHYDG